MEMLRVPTYSAAAKAHLLFSPNVARRTVFCLLSEGLLVLLVAVTPELRLFADDVMAAVELRLLRGAHAMAWWSVIAMLSSSCCALQLILSAASLGCSGLNSLLGPVRPPLLAATLLLQSSAWYVVVARKPQQAAKVAIGSAATLALTLLPELIHVLETRRIHKRQAEPASSTLLVLPLRLANVGCAACEAKVRSVAEACEGVVQCDVDLDQGTAAISIAADVEPVAMRTRVVAALTAAGYPPAPAAEAEADVDACCARPAAVATIQAGAAESAAAGQSPWCSVEQLGAIAGGLLGSSCCAVQLGLNLLTSLGVSLFGDGCAGFNTHLGPLRPYMRAATATFFALRWATCPPNRRRSLLLWTALAGGLTLLPEVLLHAGATAIAAPTDGAKRVSLRVDGMGCEACQVAVTHALQSTSGVLAASADFQAGTATLLVHPEWGFDIGTVIKAVEAAGFELDVSTATFEG